MELFEWCESISYFMTNDNAVGNTNLHVHIKQKFLPVESKECKSLFYN